MPDVTLKARSGTTTVAIGEVTYEVRNGCVTLPEGNDADVLVRMHGFLRVFDHPKPTNIQPLKRKG